MPQTGLHTAFLRKSFADRARLAAQNRGAVFRRAGFFIHQPAIMEFLKDLWSFLKERKKFWLLPVIVVLLLFGVLIVLTSGSAIAPFIYSLF